MTRLATEPGSCVISMPCGVEEWLSRDGWTLLFRPRLVSGLLRRSLGISDGNDKSDLSVGVQEIVGR